jgi:hypothetical protein
LTPVSIVRPEAYAPVTSESRPTLIVPPDPDPDPEAAGEPPEDALLHAATPSSATALKHIAWRCLRFIWTPYRRGPVIEPHTSAGK